MVISASLSRLSDGSSHDAMDIQQPAGQSGDDIPYIRVGRDARGSACWQVVDRDVVMVATSGTRAVELCEALRRRRGLAVP